jgi:cytochrome c oxidase subunit II
MREPNHMRRIVLIWAVVTVIVWPLVVFGLDPDLPPGRESDEAAGQVTDQTVLYAVAVPIAIALLIYFAYTLIVFRARGPEPGEGVVIPEDRRLARWWLIVTSAIALGLAVFGTVRLLEDGGGGGQGSDPLSKPSGEPLEVQVIGQQWDFTYRYPSFGGVETPQLVVPVDREVEFHVTSLDVVHSFWAYELGVKADANPGDDNIAYVKPSETGSFEVRCAELCGLWHGYMYDTGGRVVTDSEFQTWIQRQQRLFKPATSVLPPYRHEYFPPPERRAG